MIVAKEITQWPGAPFTPNHTYLLSDGKAKMHGYWKSGTNIFVRFEGKGVKFDPRNRKFQTLVKSVSSTAKAADINIADLLEKEVA